MKKFLLILVALCMMVSFSTAASASLVQFSPTATLGGTDTITGINVFDWAASGDLVIEQDLLWSSTGAMTLSAFFAADPNNYDQLTMTIHAQARLSHFEDLMGDEISAPGLSNDGGTTGTYEITGVLDAIETATYFNGSLFFGPAWGGSITGSFSYYLDQSPDSDIGDGSGFIDGDYTSPFLWGAIQSQSDASSFSASAQQGVSFMTNKITGYDANIIEVYPTPSDPNIVLIGTTFASTINIEPLSADRVKIPGGLIGATPYTTEDGDLVYKADASSEFSAIPEPATMLLLGSGLIGLAGFGRKKFKKQ